MTRLRAFTPLLSMAILSTGFATASAATHGKWSAPAASRSAIAAAAKAGTIEPSPSAFTNASAIMPFVEGSVYHLYAAPERVTDVVLQPGEVLGAVASGDTARWVIGDTTSGTGADKRVHVLVKPFAADLATNLVITTDRRTYHLALTSGPGASMVSLSWIYPQDALIALKQAEDAAVAAVPVATGLDVDQLHFNYVVTGDKPAWRPLRAFDDGRQTYVEFPASLASGEAPPLFLVDGKGQAQLVNYRLRGRYYVVDRIFDAAELRLGTKHQDVVRITRVAQTDRRDRAARRAS
jgi:P-type conjugative transfer protein TrbG